MKQINRLNQFPVVVIYPAVWQQWMNMKKSKQDRRKIPGGEGHLFEAKYKFNNKGEITNSKIAISSVALCGYLEIEIAKCRDQTGSITPDPNYVGSIVMQGAVTYQPVCPECQKIYREHPRSPYAKYVVGAPLGELPANIWEMTHGKTESKPKPMRRKNVRK